MTVKRAFSIGLLGALLVLSHLTYSQDMMILKDGTDLQVKVLEVGSDEVMYKKYSNLEGPTYTLDKDFVFMIKYSNGDKDFFGNQVPTNEPQANTPASSIKNEVKEKKKVKRGHFITASGGAAIPIDNFASTRNSNSKAGYALTGYHAALQGAYFIIPYVGIGAQVGHIGNPMNELKYNEALLAAIGQNSSFLTSPMTTKYQYWNNTYFGGQPYFQYASKILNVSVNGFVGGMNVMKPSIDIRFQLSNSIQTYNYVIKDAQASKLAFAYGGGLDLRFRVSRWVSISLGGTFIASDAQIDGRTNYTVTGSIVDYQQTSYKIDFQVMVVTVNGGITINLDAMEKD